MKRTILATGFAALLLPAVTMAQRGVQTFTVEGIDVIAAPLQSELVSVIVGFDAGLPDGTTNNPLLPGVVADVIASSGSKSHTKEELRRFLARTSTSLHGEGDRRGFSLRLTATRQHVVEAFKRLAAALTTPDIDAAELRRVLARSESQLERRWSDPGSLVSHLSDSLLTLGNPVYGRIAAPADVASITPAAITAYLGKALEKSRMLVTVVGQLSPAEARSMLAPLAAIPRGSYRRATLPPLATPGAPAMVAVERPLPTLYVQGSFAGPAVGSRDYWAMRVGMLHLRNILFDEIRTKRNLSYAPAARLSPQLEASVGSISVTSVHPDSATAIMLAELARMARGEIDAKELEATKQVFTTWLYQGRMTAAGVADALYDAERNGGSWKESLALDKIAKVKPADVARALLAHARNLQFAVVGPASGIDRRLYLGGGH